MDRAGDTQQERVTENRATLTKTPGTKVQKHWLRGFLEINDVGGIFVISRERSPLLRAGSFGAGSCRRVECGGQGGAAAGRGQASHARVCSLQRISPSSSASHKRLFLSRRRSLEAFSKTPSPQQLGVRRSEGGRVPGRRKCRAGRVMGILLFIVRRVGKAASTPSNRASVQAMAEP